jgi:integrase
MSTFKTSLVILDAQTGKWKVKAPIGKRIPLRLATTNEREQWNAGNRSRPANVVDLALKYFPKVDHERVDHEVVDLALSHPPKVDHEVVVVDPEKPDGSSIFKFLDWWDTEYPKTRRPLTVEKFRREYKRFRAYLKVDRPVGKVDPDVIAGYVDLRRKTVQPASMITELNTLSRMFHEAVDRKFITENPVKKLVTAYKKQYPPKDSIKYLTTGEVQALLVKLETLVSEGTVSVDIADAMKIMLATGMRVSAVVNMRWEWITADGMKIDIPPEDMMKTKTGYLADIGEIGREVLARRRIKGGSMGRVFPPNINRNRMYVVMTRHFPGVNPHRFRHSFATSLLAAGEQPVTLQKMLGHQDLESTLIYARVVDATRSKAISKLPW